MPTNKKLEGMSHLMVSPSLAEIKRGARPSEYSITTEATGGFGEDRKVVTKTVWQPVYKHENPKFVGDTVYLTNKSYRDDGRRMVRLLPDFVPQNYDRMACKIGQYLFNSRRYGRLRYYGSRDIDDGTPIYLMNIVENGKQKKILLSGEDDSELLAFRSRSQGNEVSIVDTHPIAPRDAPSEIDLTMTPSKCIDDARRSTLHLNNFFADQLEDLLRGRAAEKRLKQISENERSRWVKQIWSSMGGRGEPPDT
ncbi:MAG: hypothetical protein RTU30_07040 [Candidatus Thorarchaeota archaeon]